MTKEFGAQLVFSEDVASKAGLDVSGLTQKTAAIRGRGEPISIYVCENAEKLSLHS